MLSDYYFGLLMGGLIGYGLSLATMIMVWSLCVVAKRADEGRDYAAGKANKEDWRTSIEIHGTENK